MKGNKKWNYFVNN